MIILTGPFLFLGGEKVNRFQVKEIPLELIDDFPDHPYRVRDDTSMIELTQSIIDNGVLVPAIVRPKKDGRYEMISGHRRRRASQLAGIDKLKCIVGDYDDLTAIVIMVDSNLHRENVLPSEKAFAYKMRLEAMNVQGQRNDLTSTPLVSKCRTNELLSEQVGESREQIRRYIRLTYLVPELLEYVDNGNIKMRPAVEMSYLDEETQRDIVDFIDENEAYPSHELYTMQRSRIDGFVKDIATAKQNPKSIADIFVGMIVNGVRYDEKADAGQAIIDVCKTLPDSNTYHLGEYRGFKMEVHYEPFSHQHRVEIKGAISHQGVLGSDPLGNITRIDNVIDGLEKVLENEKAELSNTQKQLEIAKEQLQKPFSREDELKQKEVRLSELNALLNVDKKENEIVNDDNEIVNDSPQRNEIDRGAR